MLNTEESRAGGIACLNVLRTLENIAENPKLSEYSNEEFWRDRDTSIATVLQAAGVNSGFVAGFIATFAEYAHFINTAGVPHLYNWVPESILTDEDKKEEREKFDRRIDDENEGPNHA